MSDQDNPREWEHNHPTTNRFAFTGGTEMTSQDNLRDRIADVIVRKGRTGNSAAQAIIDEFGLTVETVGGFVSVAGNHDARRVVGKWERCD